MSVLDDETSAELDANPITGDMLGRDFSLSREALRSYARTAAGVGGAAAAAAGCTAIGIPGVLCAPLGRFLGETVFGVVVGLASKLRRARGETAEQFFAHSLDVVYPSGETRPQIWAVSHLRILALLDYATERRALVARTLGVSPAAASAFLSARGAPTLLELATFLGWLGDAERWNRWVSRSLNDEEAWRNPGDENLSAGARVVFGDDRNYQVFQIEQLLMEPGGPPSPPGEIDFGLMGQSPQAIELARRGQTAMRQSAPALFAYAQERASTLFGAEVTEQLNGDPARLQFTRFDAVWFSEATLKKKGSALVPLVGLAVAALLLVKILKP